MESKPTEIHETDIGQPQTDGPWENRVKPFADDVLAQLRGWADEKTAVSATQLRELFGMTKQQYQRLTDSPGYPHWERSHGERFINAASVLAFCEKFNRLARALTITEVAKFLGITVASAKRRFRVAVPNEPVPDNPQPIGQWNGAWRWDLEEIIADRDKRLGGAHMPAHAEGVDKLPPHKRKNRTDD